MKNRSDVDRLKSQWVSDPCWDIEDTDGFEDYRDELVQFSLEMKQEWQERYQQRLTAKADQLGAPGNFKLARYVINLEDKLDRINETLEQVYYRKSR